MKMVIACLVFILAAVHGNAVVAQSNSKVTYQGELQENGNPAAGTYDFQFALWTAADGGSQIGPTKILNAVPVLNGRFVVELDFGSDVFDNSDRWLQIQVNGTGLSPRQPITRTPYAIQTRGIFVNDELTFAGIGRQDALSGNEVFGIHSPTTNNFGGMFASTEGSDGLPFYGYSAGGGFDAFHYFDGPNDRWILAVGSTPAALTVQSDGNVGIGTTAPTAILEVSNDANAATALLGESTSPTGVNYGVLGRIASTESGASAVYAHATAETGNTRAGRFINDSSTTGASAILAQALGTSGFTFGVQASIDSDDGIALSGFVPNGRLGTAVRGTANNENAFAGRFLGRVHMRDHATVGPVQTRITDAELFGIHAGEEPGFTGMYISSLSDLGEPFYGYSAGGDVDAYTYFTGDSGQWRLFCSGDRLTVNASDGQVGINTNSPSFRLHVNGSAGKPGGGSWSNTSDRRLKKDIRNLDSPLESMLKLRGVTFQYRDPEIINELAGPQIGMIAQEVEQVFPDWVDQRPDGYRTVTYRGFEALTVEAFRELRQEKDAEIRAVRIEAEARISELEQRITEMEARFDLLSSTAGLTASPSAGDTIAK